MIPALVTDVHIREAMRRITGDGFPPRHKSRKYCLVEDGRHFPPKYTIALAHEAATGSLLGSNKFSGGAESKRFLLDRNFDVTECDCGGYNHDTHSTPRTHPGRPRQDGSLGGDRKRPSSSGVAGRSPSGQTAPSLRVAMVFPELVSRVPPVGAFAGEDVDFVLFPEGYINSSEEMDINDLKDLASKLSAPLLVGASDYEDGGAQILLRFDPDGSDPIRLYKKHSAAGAVAFDEYDWNSRGNLPTFELGGVRAGATICHDSYLGLLQRHLAKSGAHLWLNPSYDNVKDIKWSSVLRLRAVENRFFALCTLHDDMNKAATRPFAFSPDGNELHAREAGSADKRPISECMEAGAVYIVDLDIASAGKPLDWSSLPRADKPQSRNKNPKKPVLVSLRDGQPAVYVGTRWNTNASGCIKTKHGGVYVGEVCNEDILDVNKCFDVIYEAHQMNCRPIIWNHWDEPLPTEPERLAVLMMGRAIECCAPIVISDQTGIRELVELANQYKHPIRRTVELSEAMVDVKHAYGLPTAFKMVAKDLHHSDYDTAMARYRSLD